MFKYHLLPAGLQEGAKLYIEHGIRPGGFLTACFKDELVEAFSLADSHNSRNMEDIVRWLYSCCPMPARGSKENVNRWIKQRGLENYNG